jgi:hypothetical protein
MREDVGEVEGVSEGGKGVRGTHCWDRGGLQPPPSPS